MGQRPPKPTEKDIAAARAKYEADVRNGRRVPLPDCGQLRDSDGAWRPAVGPGYEIVTPRRAPAERRAKGVNFSPLDYGRRPSR